MNSPAIPPTLADLVRAALAALFARICLVETAEQLRDGTLRWPTVAELLLARGQHPALDDKLPRRLRAGARAAEALGRDDVAEAVVELATAEGLTPAAWEEVARDRWVALMCETCGDTWPSATAAEQAGCLTVAPGWVLCPDCRSEPEPPPPPAPAPTRRDRPALVRSEGTAALAAAAGTVASPAAAVAWWVEQAAALEALPRADRDAVRTALARRVMEVGGGGTASLPAARNFLTRKIASAPSAPSAEASAPPAPPPVALTLVPEPAPLDGDGEAEAGGGVPEPEPAPLDGEAVLARFEADVAEIRLPGQAAAVWVAHRAALSTLPKPTRDAAERALGEHVARVGYMARPMWFLRKSVAELDARLALAPAAAVRAA